MIEKLLNWSGLSVYLTGGDRKTIRSYKIPKKHWIKIDNLIYKQLPEWWEQKKKML